MWDVIVVGGGPAGLRLAYRLAEAGREVVVFDERVRIGRRKICTGIVGLEAFRRFGLSGEAILTQIQRLKFFSPRGQELDYSHPHLLAHVVDRTAFDRGLARASQRRGACVQNGIRVRKISVREGNVEVETVPVAESGAPRREVGKLLALATGANVRLNRSVGLGVPVDFLNAVQAHIPVRGLECTHCYVGHDVAPGAFGWLVPLGTGWARVGLMTQARAEPFFKRLVRRVAAYRMRPEEPLEAEFKPIVQRFQGKSYGHRVIAVGEAAGQVKTTTGGGIYFSLLGAEVAAGILDESLRKSRFDADFLARYEELWRKEMAAELETGYRYRKAFSRLSNDQIEALFRLARFNGILPLVRRKAKFDWHREVLTSLTRYRLVQNVLGLQFGEFGGGPGIPKQDELT